MFFFCLADSKEDADCFNNLMSPHTELDMEAAVIEERRGDMHK
jgi:hypothetical protein